MHIHIVQIFREDIPQFCNGIDECGDYPPRIHIYVSSLCGQEKRMIPEEPILRLTGLKRDHVSFTLVCPSECGIIIVASYA